MVNPFKLPGPEFLVFYAIFGFGVNLLLRYLIRRSEKKRPNEQFNLDDPYKLAYLRKGIDATLQVVIISLIDRGLLKSSYYMVVAEPHAVEMVNKSIERSVIDYFTCHNKVKFNELHIFAAEALQAYNQELLQDGYLANKSINDYRRNMSLIALLALFGVSIIKIVTALSQGKDNIVILILLTFYCAWFVYFAYDKESTGAGDEVLARSKQKYKSLKKSIIDLRPGEKSSDLALFAAVFGISAISTSQFSYVSNIFSTPVTVIKSASGGGGEGGGGGGGGGGACGGGCGGCGGG